MKNVSIRSMLAAAAALTALNAGAAVTQHLGAGAASSTYTNTATFEANTALANDYVEDGLLFTYTGSDANNQCGYGGLECYDSVSELSPAFAGNYLGTAGNNAYVSIRLANGGDLHAIEFAIGSGFYAAPLNAYWQTWQDGALTGSGNVNAAPLGTVLGLADTAGFDEVRYFAFNTASRSSGWSSPDIDNVRVLAAVPEPSTWAMLAAGIGLLGLACRSRKAD